MAAGGERVEVDAVGLALADEEFDRSAGQRLARFGLHVEGAVAGVVIVAAGIGGAGHAYAGDRRVAGADLVDGAAAVAGAVVGGQAGARLEAAGDVEGAVLGDRSQYQNALVGSIRFECYL